MTGMEKAIGEKIAELENIAVTITDLKKQQKEKKNALDQNLAFFGLKYVRCGTCNATGKAADGSICPDCAGTKVNLVPLDADDTTSNAE